MKGSLKKKLAYQFDNYMARGPWSIFLALMVVFISGFAIISVIRIAVSPNIPNDVNSSLGLWRIFLQLTDPGNMAQDNDSLWYVKLFAIFSGMFGIIFFSAVIAFITTQLDRKLADLRKGKSTVLEKGHILILGWNQQITEIIKEIIIAHESEKKSSIVILSETGKEEMDDYLGEEISERGKTKIITRTGQTSSLSALKRVAVKDAKSVILLPTCPYGSDAEELAYSDSHTLKSTLAVIAAGDEESEIPQIVVQVYNESNSHIIQNLAPQKIIVVNPEDMVAKIAVQTSRSTGLSAVYASLIGFEGCEFYFTKVDWNGISFKDIHFHYKDGVAIGLKKKNGNVIINPDSSYKLTDDDTVIILAEDDSTISYDRKEIIEYNDYDIKNIKNKQKNEKLLIIGWNSKGKTIIDEYQDYVLKGSSIDIVPVALQRNLDDEMAAYTDSCNNNICIKPINPLNIIDLESLKPEEYNSIIILTSNMFDQERADANTINILLLLRDIISRKTIDHEPQIIAEVSNSENLELITETGANDAIISTKMISKVLAQIAEEPDVLSVYNEIFTTEGSEIYLKPIDLFLESIPDELTFADLIALTQKRNEICIGYRSEKNSFEVSNNFGIILNPKKNQVLDMNDINYLIVIAEDEL